MPGTSEQKDTTVDGLLSPFLSIFHSPNKTQGKIVAPINK